MSTTNEKLLSCGCNLRIVRPYHKHCPCCGKPLIDFVPPDNTAYAFQTKSGTRYYVQRSGSIVRFKRVRDPDVFHRDDSLYAKILFVDPRVLAIIHAYSWLDDLSSDVPFLPAIQKPAIGLAPAALEASEVPVYDGSGLKMDLHFGGDIMYGSAVEAFLTDYPEPEHADDADVTRVRDIDALVDAASSRTYFRDLAVADAAIEATTIAGDSLDQVA